MAETRITDIIVPEVFGPYIKEKSLNLNPFYQSGIIAPSAEIVAFLNGGGKTSNIPYWQDLTGDADVPSETVATTVNELGTDKMIVIRQLREKAWGANALSAALSGANPLEAIGSRVAGFWGVYMQTNLIQALTGVFADNVANDSGDLVVDIAADTAAGVSSATKISATKTIEAIMKQGDQFKDVKAIAVHSVVYATMVKNDLIDYVQDSTTGTSIPFYVGLRVIVDDKLPVVAVADTFHYHSYLFKPGSVGYGEATNGKILPVETFRNPAVGGGVDILYTRRQFAFAPLGFSWVKADNAAITPAHSDLYAATSWNRVYDKKNTGVIDLISNG